MLTSRASPPKRRSTSRTACLTQAGGARGRREWAARAGGAGGRRKRAARAGGAREWREVTVCRLRADGAVLLEGRGWPPVRREQVDGHRAFPEEGRGVVGALHPKDLPAFVDDPRGGNPFLVYPRSGPFSRQDVSRHGFRGDRSKRATKTRGRRRRGPRKRRARVWGRRAGSKRERPPLSLALSARRLRRSYHPHSPSFFAPPIKAAPLPFAAEDQGSDGRGCGDGAREASESGLPSLWRSQLGAAVVPITRTPRPFSPPPLRPALSPTPTTPTPTAPRPPLSDVARRHNTRPNTRQKASSPPTPAHHAARLMRALSSHAHARRPRTSRAARPLLLLPWRARVDHVSRREADAPPPLAPAANAAPTFCCTASAVRQRAAARALRTTRTEAGAADARGSARPLVSRRAAALAAARCSVRVATAASVVVMAPRRASAVAAVRASGTSALLLVACPSVSACAALSAARAQCDASDGPSRFPPRPVRAFPLIRNPRAGALARSEERRQQGPPPQVRAHVPARSRRRRPASSDRGRRRRAGPPRPIRPTARAPWDRTWREGGEERRHFTSRVFRVRELAGRSGSSSETPPLNPPRRSKEAGHFTTT